MSFNKCKNTYTIRPQLLQALRNRAIKVYGSENIKEYYYNAGLYYEINDMISLALEMYEKCDNKEKIKKMLIKNSKKNPSSGHFFEFRKYYLKLTSEDVKDNPILMSALSIFYSMLMQTDNSEYYYNMLKDYEKKSKGGQKREAISQLAYLDIALPQRKSYNLIEIFKSVPVLLFDKGISLPEFSVTSNLPSLMNGGKDFCHWTKKDVELSSTIGNLVKKILGKYGKGLVNIALTESFFEKGNDNYEVLLLLSKGELEAQLDGTIEMLFVSIGLQIRLSIVMENYSNTINLITSFENRVIKENAHNLMSNLQALKCRIALYSNDDTIIYNWLNNISPNEMEEFFSMKRYEYLTKIRCYIYLGEYLKAISLIEKVNLYTQEYGREYIIMKLGIFKAIVKYHLGYEWLSEFLETLKKISDYNFIRVISEEGSAILKLLEISKNDILSYGLDSKWFKRVLDETKEISIKYPNYLKRQAICTSNFSIIALDILKLQANGLSVPQI